MATSGNTLGSIYISIVGDQAQFVASLQAAQGTAAAGGARIGSALASGLGPGTKAATGLVDQFGFAIKTATAPIPAFVVQANAAGVAIQRVGAAAAHSVTDIQATSAAIRLAELNMNGGIRAAERFIASTLGLGGAFKAIFPIIGSVAVGEIIGRIASKITELYTAIRDSKEKIGGGFGDLNVGLAQTNDELIVTGDKLDNALAKLSSKPQNQLRLSIHEAAVEAEKLRGALTGAADAAFKLASEDAPGWFQKIGAAALGAVQGPKELALALVHIGELQSSVEGIGGKTGFGGLRGEEAKAFDDLLPKLRAATSEKEKEGIQTELNTRLQKAYNDEINRQHYLADSPGASTAQQEIARGLASNLQQQLTGIALRQADADKQQREEALEAQRSAAAEEVRIPAAQLAVTIAATERLKQILTQSAESRVTLAKRGRDAEIAQIEDVHERAIATAQSEVKAAQDKADAIKAINAAFLPGEVTRTQKAGTQAGAGKTPTEAAVEQIGALGKIQALRAADAEAAQKLDDEVAENAALVWSVTQAEVRKQNDETAKALEKALSDIDRRLESATEKDLSDQRKILEFRAKAAGSAAEGGVQGQALAVQRGAALGGPQTGQQQLATLQAVNQLEEQRRNIELQALSARQEAAAHAADWTQAEQLAAEATKMQADNANATYAAKTKELELAQQLSAQYQIQADLTKAANSIPSAIGGAVSSGVFGSKRHGEDVGTQIEKSLKNVGQQLFGNLLSTGIKELVKTIGLNTAGQALLHAIGLTQTTISTAQTTATAASTTAAGVLAAATSADVAATVALTGAIGALIVAITGNTTALLLNAFVPKPFGFAAGGSPPVGVASIVGEHGPELFVPNNAGTIVPNGQFGGGLPDISGVSSVSSTSVGQMHFHAHGMTNPREFTQQIARELPKYLKSTGPQFSPRSR